MERRPTTLIALLLVLLLTLTGSAGAAAQATPGASPEASPTELENTATDADLEAAVSWLISQQDASGGFTGFSGEPEVSVTTDAVYALVAAQGAGVDIGPALDDAVAYIASGDGALVYTQSGVGQAAKLVLAAAAWGGDPNDIAGVDPLSIVQNGIDTTTGVYGTGLFDHALVLLALGATGSDVPAEAVAAVAAVEAAVTPEGGWSYDGSTDSGLADSNTTALIVMGLVATGNGDHPLVGGAMAFLQTTLVGTAGASFQASDVALADANSTALVAQAVIAVGDDPAGEGWGNLDAALAAFQNPDGGFFYTPEDTTGNLFSTLQAIPAVAGSALPVIPPTDLDAAAPAATPTGRRESWDAARAA